MVLKVVCLKCSVGRGPVWFELCGAGRTLREKDDDDDGGCMHASRAAPQETLKHFDV